MSETSKMKVVLVGHCGPDAYALRSAVRTALPEVEFVTANDEAELAKAREGADLLLVNRVLDGDFDTGGIELVGKLAAAGARVMLISNYADAQAEAERAGALPGFGKTTMYSEEAKLRLRAALT
jgi:two-component system, chemotaxis family, chemotaxis protein CheY